MTAKRMSLASVTQGTIDNPPRILLYGQPGVGKSTLACSIPGAIVVPGEDGTERINTARFPKPETWADVRESVTELTESQHDYRAAVFDTLDGLEPLVFADVCAEAKTDSIEKAFGGYYKGYTRAVEKWRELLAMLERLRAKRGMAIVFVAHSAVKTFHNPEGSDYDRYIPKMNEKAWGVFFEWCDAVVFAQYETLSLGSDPDEKSKAVSTGSRVLRTARRASWEAKNRYGFPESIPMQLERGWSPIAEYLAAPKKMRAEIESLLSRAEPDLVAAVRGWLNSVGENAIELTQGLERLKVRLATPATVVAAA